MPKPPSSPAAPDRIDRAILASFVPAAVQRLVSKAGGSLTEAHREAVPGAVLFADVSGFTALTERLAAKGPAGVELLTRTLNTYFGTLIEVLVAHGGDVLKFAGDALLASFAEEPEDGADARRRAVLRAAACGLAAKKALGGQQSNEGIALSIKLAVSAGELECAYVGGVWGRWELVVFGAPLSDAGSAAERCEPGAVVLAPSAWRLVGRSCLGQELGGGFVRLDGLTAAGAPPPWRSKAPLLLSESAAAAAWAFLPGAIRNRLQEGHGEWLAELRKITVIFVALPGQMSEVGLSRTQELVTRLQQLVYRVEGSVNKVSADDKGRSLVAVLGMPPLAHEDDPRRGVVLALDMRDLLREFGSTCSIGVATGRAFCGVIGSELRREYTMMGDIVNLAARLMVASGGNVLCDAATREGAKAHFDFQELPRLKLKGKSEPVAVFRPSLRAASHAASAKALVGRQDELNALAAALDELEAGVSSVFIIEAEAGIGKSRLLEELRALGHRRERIRSLHGSADAIEKNTAYLAWRGLLAMLFADEAEVGPAGRAAAAQRLLQSRPDLLAWVPLLETILPLGHADTELTHSLEGEGRAATLRTLIVAALQAAAERAPLLISIEDTHWMDSASWALLLAAARAVSPMLLVLASRPVSEAQQCAEQLELYRDKRTRILRLEGLLPQHARAFICAQLGADTIAEEVLDLITRRTEGNPFFTEQLALALRDAGALIVTDGHAALRPGVNLTTDVSLPDTLNGVVTQRIDRLAPTEQLALKVASVVGRSFSAMVVNDIFPIEAVRGRLTPHLASLSQVGLTSPNSDGIEQSYLFRHIITQEVTYNLMLFEQRRALHLAVAEWFENNIQDLSPYYPLIAHHFMRAEAPARAIPYLLRAGDQALASSANAEALSFFADAARLDAARPGGPDPSRQAHCAIQMGFAHYSLARIDESDREFQRGLALTPAALPQTRSGILRGLLKEAAIQALHRQLPSRLAPLWRAAETLELRLLANAYNTLSQIRYLRNDRLGIFFCGLKALNLAEQTGESVELTEALGSMAVVATFANLRTVAASYAARAEQQLPRVADPLRRSSVLIFMLLYRGSTCDWAGGIKFGEEIVQLSERIANARLLQGGLQGIARCAMRWGRFSVAATAYERMWELGRRADNGQATAWGLGGLLELQLAPHGGLWAERIVTLREVLAAERGRDHLTDADYAVSHGRLAGALWRLERFDEAEAEAAAAAELLLKTDAVATHTVDALATVAEVYLGQWQRRGHLPADARWLLERIVKSLDQYGSRLDFGRPIAQRIRGSCHWQKGRRPSALQDWADALASAQVHDMPYEAAHSHHMLAAHLTAGAARRQYHLDAARTLYRKLGASFDLQRLAKLS